MNPCCKRKGWCTFAVEVGICVPFFVVGRGVCVPLMYTKGLWALAVKGRVFVPLLKKEGYVCPCCSRKGLCTLAVVGRVSVSLL